MWTCLVLRVSYSAVRLPLSDSFGVDDAEVAHVVLQPAFVQRLQSGYLLLLHGHDELQETNRHRINTETDTRTKIHMVFRAHVQDWVLNLNTLICVSLTRSWLVHQVLAQILFGLFLIRQFLIYIWIIIWDLVAGPLPTLSPLSVLFFLNFHVRHKKQELPINCTHCLQIIMTKVNMQVFVMHSCSK